MPLNALGSLVATVHGGEFNDGFICFLRGLGFADAVDDDDDRLRTTKELVLKLGGRLTGIAVLSDTPPLFLLLDSSEPIAT